MNPDTAGVDSRERKLLLIAVVPVFLFYLYLNLTIPLYADDYWYSLVFGTSRHLESLRDVWVSQSLHYRTWGGRTVAHSLGQLALMGSRQTLVFRFFNAAVFTGLNLLMVRLAVDSSRPDWKLFLLSFLLFWLFVPRLGETTLWLIGSVNYLWNAFFVLLFLDISRNISQGRTGRISESREGLILPVVFHVFLGLLAGWGFETTSLTGLLIALFFLVSGVQKLKQLPGILAYAAGYFMLVSAPGNRIRAERIDASGSLFSKVLDNLPRYIGMHVLSWALLLFLLLLFVCSLRTKGLKKTPHRAWLFLIAGILNNGLMLAAPSIPMRSGFGASVFFIISALILVADMELFRKRVFTVFLTAMAVFSLVTAVDSGISYGKLKVLDNERKSIARDALAAGASEFEWPLPDVRFNQRVFERDIRSSPSYWVNGHVARFYNVNAVFGEQPGLQYYEQSEPWLNVDVDFGDIALKNVSRYLTEDRIYLYFIFQGDAENADWGSLSFRFRYIDDMFPRPVRRLIRLLPDNFGGFLRVKGDFVSRIIRDDDDVIYSTSLPAGRELMEIDFQVESRPGSWQWLKGNQ